ncbi:hypothetical protein [Sporisorium scitamineum]|uniref:Uncharacterized protein n=1 Tax=Sporisorium scitamineum TaxID=49012 RepID=A0A0F7RRR1_9BASI|nr:hypothetical protein [Sporisorium scitamineum]
MYYSHLMSAHPQLEQDALVHANNAGNGPFYVQSYDKGRKLFLATKVSGASNLGQRWGLRYNHDGVVSLHDARLSWRVDANGPPKLLSLELWPPGSNVQEIMTLEQAMSRLSRV